MYLDSVRSEIIYGPDPEDVSDIPVVYKNVAVDINTDADLECTGENVSEICIRLVHNYLISEYVSVSLCMPVGFIFYNMLPLVDSYCESTMLLYIRYIYFCLFARWIGFFQTMRLIKIVFRNFIPTEAISHSFIFKMSQKTMPIFLINVKKLTSWKDSSWILSVNVV